MKIRYLFSLLLLLAVQAQVQSSTLTNLVATTNGAPACLMVKTGQLARVTGGNYDVSQLSGLITISIGGIDFPYPSGFFPNGTPVPGPATITLTDYGYDNGFFCTIECVNAGEAFSSTNAFALSADSTAPVKTTLKSSTESITQTPAPPGSYGISTDKRFFRVKPDQESGEATKTDPSKPTKAGPPNNSPLPPPPSS